MKGSDVRELRDFWEKQARRDPLWAILSDPSKKGRKWNIADFFETGRREISVLIYHLESLKIGFLRRKALDFGCGIGRLTQALAGYFDLVVGIDISETMIRLAKIFNRFEERACYLSYQGDDLEILEDQAFDFVYANIVLQHLRPEMTLRYFEEFRRILKSGGLLIFQLPSHPRGPDVVKKDVDPMNEGAYVSSIRLEEASFPPLEPSTEMTLRVYVKNASLEDWVQNSDAPIRVGNHWLAGDGKTMLIQDDGRGDLPRVLGPGEESLVYLTIRTPPRDGDYLCEIDLVHESISWFKDKGAPTALLHFKISSGTFDSHPKPNPSPLGAPAIMDEDSKRIQEIYRQLPAEVEDQGKFPMFGIPREEVVSFFRSRGDDVIRIEEDEHSGREWVGCRYFVRRNSDSKNEPAI
jgi:SAM-dependent methyltransferase